MKFSQWLHEVETATKPPVQTAVTKQFKTQLQNRLRSQAGQSASGKPTEDPEEIVNQVATQTMARNDAGPGDVAALAGAMKRTKDTARPQQQGRMA